MPARTRHATPRTQLMRFDLSMRTLVRVGLVIGAVWLIVHLAPVLLVLTAALMLAGALNPVIDGLERRRIRRGFAIALVFTAAVAVLALGLFLTIPPLVGQLRTLVEQEPAIRAQLVMYLDTSPLTQALADELRYLQYGELIKDSREWLLNASIHAVGMVAYGFAAVFLALYIIIDRDRLRGALFAVVPRKHHVRTSRILLNLETIVGGYIRGQIICCTSLGVFIFTLLRLCDVPNALALAVFGAFADVLPYLGPLLTIVPAVIAAYQVGPWVAVTVLVAILIYEEFESRVLVPIVYGRSLRLPSSVIFLALLTGAVLGGIVGALIALPIASMLLMLLHELRVDLPGEAGQAAAVERRKDKREEREYVERSEDTPAVEAAVIAAEFARHRLETKDDKPTHAVGGR